MYTDIVLVSSYITT